MAETLRFLDKPLLALGAGNGDFALAAGNADDLSALGAVKVPMLPILQTVKKLEEFAVLLIALVGIAGEAAIQRPDHQSVGNAGQQQIQLDRIHKRTDKACHKTGGQNGHIQFIGSVAAGHKLTQSITHPL